MKRRTAVLVASGVVVVVLAVILVLVLAGDDEEVQTGDDATTTTAEDATTTTGDDETTTTSAGAGEPGDVVVAVDGDGQVVVLDPDSGEAERVLMEGVRVDDPAKNEVALAPGRNEAFVVQPGEIGESGEIVRVALDGSESEVVAEGLAPSVSPDGDRLAYVTFEDQGELQPAPVLVIRDLDTGEERRLAREQEPQFHFVSDSAWTADGEHVAFVAGEIRTGLYLVEADADSLDEAEHAGPDGREEGTSWRAVTAFGDARLAVVETCCDVPDSERWTIVAFDISERQVEGGLLPEDRVEAAAVDSPDGEARLLYVTDRRPGRGTLNRWDGSGDSRVVAENIVVAAW